MVESMLNIILTTVMTEQTDLVLINSPKLLTCCHWYTNPLRSKRLYTIQ